MYGYVVLLFQSDTVAKRTRSRLPLTNTTISSLEAEFVPPDITVDMYEDPQLEDEDPDWKDFLQNLQRDGMQVFLYKQNFR